VLVLQTYSIWWLLGCSICICIQQQQQQQQLTDIPAAPRTENMYLVP
jgi:hypothetical protein